MLMPAILYKNEICNNIAMYNYTDDMLNYTGYLGNSIPNIAKENDGSLYQFAIVDNGDKLVGYFTYQVNWYASCAHNFGLFSFEKSNKTIGLDVYKELKKIINNYHIHRLEWRMVGGNPVEKHYDKFCKKYHGNKFVLTDVIKDRYGKYHDDIIYEIIFEQEEKQCLNTKT